ncbi:hypothetical protein [Rhizobium sp. L9]|nr:hypothetical protein [Rhizobium sp. L9]
MSSPRDRLLAQWVSEVIGTTDIEAYVAEIIGRRGSGGKNPRRCSIWR